MSNLQQVKFEHQRSGGLSQDIGSITWKLEEVIMDFIFCSSLTRRQHDSIWIIIYHMIKLAHFIPVKVF